MIEKLTMETTSAEKLAKSRAEKFIDELMSHLKILSIIINMSVFSAWQKYSANKINCGGNALVSVLKTGAFAPTFCACVVEKHFLLPSKNAAYL